MIGDVCSGCAAGSTARARSASCSIPKRRAGYASEAATALLEVAFGPLGLHRVFGRTDARNVASAALMRRLGMRQEAHLRENEIFKGAWGDELVFAVLEDEWNARRPQ